LFAIANNPVVYSNKDAVHYKGVYFSTSRLEKEFKTSFMTPDSYQKLDDFNPIIILGSTIDSIAQDLQKSVEAARREREIFNALDKGKLVCLIFKIDQLLNRVFKRAKINFNVWGRPRVDLKTRRSEFESLIKGFGSTKYDWMGDFDDIISETKDGKIVGFSKKVGKGVLVFLPCYMPINDFWDIEVMKDFLPCLLKSLENYSPRIQYKPPTWVDSYCFPKEEPIISEIERLQRELDGREEFLKDYNKLKEVLWFRNDQLVTSSMNFFKAMGIETKRYEIHEEDFWITEKDKEIVIVEVKGLDKNVTRLHITKLDEHKMAREKPDEFPALLIVNTFNKANSLEEKDKAISPNVIKKAVKTNILLIRTLDLCNYYYLMEKENFTSTQLLDLFKTETGWLKVTQSGYNIIKK